MKKVVLLALLVLLNFQAGWAETLEGKVATQEPLKTFKILDGYLEVYKNKVFIHTASFLAGHEDKILFFKDIISITSDKGISFRFNTSEVVICNKIECNRDDNLIFFKYEGKGKFYNNPDYEISFTNMKNFLENQLEQYKESH